MVYQESIKLFFSWKTMNTSTVISIHSRKGCWKANKAPRNFYTFYLHHGTNIPCARFRVMHRIIQQPL
uniref:Uncharacterized protein n=1 Tax=Trichogramma kaykai TaxID=54128 RepID=A0ABD2WDS6_9HYME